MHKIKISPKGQKMFAVLVSLPNSIIDLKAQCRIQDSVLMTDQEFDFAFANGLNKLLKDGIALEVKKDINSAPKAVKPEILNESPAEPEDTRSIMEIQDAAVLGESYSEEDSSDDEPSKKKSKKKSK